MTRWLLPLVAVAGGLVGAGGVVALGKVGTGARGDGAGVREYLLANPEVIPEAMERLQRREQAKAVAQAGDAVTTPYAGAWMGNPKGDVTLVEFYDYNCGYCRQSAPLLAELVRRDPKLKIVFREYPILSPTSQDASRAALQAARQNRFKPFHDALYAGGRVSPESIAAAAAKTGVRLSADHRAADAEIASNGRIAAELGVTGTPSWVVGDEVLVGAQGLERLEKAIAAARRAG